MELFVSAGEASSDIHCAHLILELKKLAAAAKGGPVDLQVFGLGGDQLAAQGAELLMHNREFSVGGGPREILSKLPRRHRLEKLLEQRLIRKPPDGAILVDSGELNLRLASLLHFFGVPVVYFIPPKVWVWRSSRIEAIAQHVRLVLSILPFEEPFYREWEIPFQYVGNPLLDQVPAQSEPALARARLGLARLSAETPIITVLPGSRHSEIKYHASIFSEAIARMVKELPAGSPQPAVVIPVAQAIEPEPLRQRFEAVLRPLGVSVFVVKGSTQGHAASHDAMAVARVALVKSGTSTLEAALVGTPMVLAYYVSRSSAWIYRHIVRYRGFVGLVNLFLSKNPEAALGWAEPEKPVVPEVILSDCTAENIAAELLKIYRDGSERQAMLERLAETRHRLMPPPALGASPMSAAAKATWKVFASTKKTGGPPFPPYGVPAV